MPSLESVPSPQTASSALHPVQSLNLSHISTPHKTSLAKLHWNNKIITEKGRLLYVLQFDFYANVASAACYSHIYFKMHEWQIRNVAYTCDEFLINYQLKRK